MTRDTPHAKRGHRPMRALPIILVAIALFAAWWAGWLDYFSLSSLIMHRSTLEDYVAAHWMAALAGYMVLYIALVTISFPGASLLTLASGFLFGGLVGGMATVLSATAGASLIFLAARTSAGEFLAARAGPFLTRMADGFNRDAFNYLLSIRLMPVFPFWVVNIVPALLNMRFRDYLAATFLGIIPGTFAYAYVGAGLGSVITAQEAASPGCAATGECAIDPASLLTPQILIGMSALAVISILPVVVRRLRARKGPAGD